MARWCELVNRVLACLDHPAIRSRGFTGLHRLSLMVRSSTGSNGNTGVSCRIEGWDGVRMGSFGKTEWLSCPQPSPFTLVHWMAPTPTFPVEVDLSSSTGLMTPS